MDITLALFWACAAVCAVAELLILRAAFRPADDPSPSATVPRSRRGLEIVWGILPAIALVAVFVVAWRSLR
jgi:heme/copper-type cytochrome/quinol oxidase subunit 2